MKNKYYLLIILLILISSCSIEEETEEETEKKTIFDDSIVFGTSLDEHDWEVSSPIIEHASVPDLIQLSYDLEKLNEETLMVYFVDGSESEENDKENIGMIYSKDNGKTWSDKKIIEIEGAEEHVPVDPSIVQLDNGNLRLYYYDINSFRNHANAYSIYVAESEDGVNFYLLQESYRSDFVITDPEVVYFNNEWFMFTAKQDGMIVLSSQDGINFNKIWELDIKGIPGAMVVNDSIHLYGCDNGGITNSVSNDGKIFSPAVVILLRPVCDPSPFYLEDGTFTVALKKYPST